jgi:hypothetical protein
MLRVRGDSMSPLDNPIAMRLLMVATACAITVSASKLISSSSKQLSSRALQVTPGVSTTFTVPLIGSLGPIEGQVVGLANPQDYTFCVYLTSTTSGTALVDGPKPFGDSESYTPIDATGHFSFTNWWSNDVFDPVVPTITGFVWPNSMGNCTPYLGVVVDGGLLSSPQATGSVAYTSYSRMNTAALSSLDLSTTGSISGVLTGLPTDFDAQPLYALVYSRTATGTAVNPYSFTGPLAPNDAVCDQTAGFVVRRNGDGDGDGSTGTFNIACTGSCASSQLLTVIITSGSLLIIPDAAVPPIPGAPDGKGICVTNTLPLGGVNSALPPGVAGPSLLHLSFSRATPPSNSPSAVSSNSNSASGTPTPDPTRFTGSDSQSGTDSGSPSSSITPTVSGGGNNNAPPPPLNAASGVTSVNAFNAILAVFTVMGLAAVLV